MSSSTTLLTDEEFLALPKIPGKQELIDGELISLPPSKHSHDALAEKIAGLLRLALPVGRVWIESGYQLGPRKWLQPDVSVTWPDQKIENDYKQGGPMIAVEISSGANTDEQMERKRLQYLEHGTAEVWIIYPATRTMLVCGGDFTRHIRTPDTYRCEIVPVEITPEYRTADSATVRPRD
jgi:Uma2 family endonuclease